MSYGKGAHKGEMLGGDETGPRLRSRPGPDRPKKNAERVQYTLVVDGDLLQLWKFDPEVNCEVTIFSGHWRGGDRPDKLAALGHLAAADVRGTR